MKRWYVTLWVDPDPESQKFTEAVYASVIAACQPSLAVHRAFQEYRGSHPGMRIGTLKAKAQDLRGVHKGRLVASVDGGA